MISLNKYLIDNKLIYRISSNIKPYDCICSVEIYAVLIDKNISTDIVFNVLNRSMIKKYKGYKLNNNYIDYFGKYINLNVKDDNYIGIITINKPYKTYGIGFYSLIELSNYSYEGLTINEMIIDKIKESDIYK